MVTEQERCNYWRKYCLACEQRKRCLPEQIREAIHFQQRMWVWWSLWDKAVEELRNTLVLQQQLAASEMTEELTVTVG